MTPVTPLTCRVGLPFRRHRQLQQLRKVRRAVPRHWIPSLRRIPARSRNDGTAQGAAPEAAPSVAARAAAARDVVQRLVALAVEPGVQEAEHGLAGAQAGVVQQGHDGREGGRRRRRALQQGKHALVVHGVVDALGRDVRESASALVVQALPLVAQLGEVGLDGLLLVVRPRPQVREAAGREGRCSLLLAPRRAHGRHPRTRGRELRQELRLVFAVVGHAACAHARVAGREEHRHAAAAQLREEVAHGAGVAFGDALLAVSKGPTPVSWLVSYLLVFAVRGRDHLRQVLLRQLEDLLQEVQVRLVLVVGRGGLVDVRDEIAQAAGRVLGHGQRRAQAEDVLQIEVGLAAVGGRVLVVAAAVELHDGEVLALGPRRQVALEQGQVGVARVFLQVAGEGDLAAAVRVGGVVADVVEVLQARRRDDLLADERLVEAGAQTSPRQRTMGLARQGFRSRVLALRADVAEARGRLDHVDVLGQLVGHGVLESAQATDVRVVADIPAKLRVEQLVGDADRRTEVDPVGVLLDIADAGALQPGDHGVDGLVGRQQQALHLIVRLEVPAVARMARGRHVEHGLLEGVDIVLLQRDLQADGLVVAGSARESPARGRRTQPLEHLAGGRRGQQDGQRERASENHGVHQTVDSRHDGRRAGAQSYTSRTDITARHKVSSCEMTSLADGQGLSWLAG